MDECTQNDILTTKKSTAKKAKRLWQEIEKLKDRRQLLQELKELDPLFDGDVDDFLFR